MPARTTQSTLTRTNDEWLSLRRASALIGVHPATLRSWADQGRVASQRTAGGHRRFRRSDLEQWAKTQGEPSPNVEILIHSALGRVRLSMDQAGMPWLARLAENDRAQHRDLGRRLLMELATALNASLSAPASAATGRSLGDEYARLSHGQGLTLIETVQAFLFFRDSIVDSLIQMASHLGSPASPDWVILNRRLNGFIDAVLLGLIDTYRKMEANP